jgi:formylglycine-generating enzyme
LAAFAILAIVSWAGFYAWQHHESTPTGDPVITGKAGKYVRIHADRFQMGCSMGDAECEADEKPPYRVVLSHDFYMGATEVTVRAYRQYAKETGLSLPPTVLQRFSKTDDAPIVGVSWEEAGAYCKWDGGGQLPTEAQWEFAARAGSTVARYGELNAIAWYHENSPGSGANPVGLKLPNRFGLYDMLGNVWEWCSDWYDKDYYENTYKGAPVTDPTGPSSGEGHSMRGGAWSGVARYARASSRAGDFQKSGPYGVGFRCVREVR